ncbi:MAG: twin-arginine translocation signal domain-containing protein, partial [Candidatus Rokubacteria bacterium]|nr:twin-arginine translocation signal domain-containing protein [Candidatus Rokubacteria bacterium]
MDGAINRRQIMTGGGLAAAALALGLAPRGAAAT